MQHDHNNNMLAGMPTTFTPWYNDDGSYNGKTSTTTTTSNKQNKGKEKLPFGDNNQDNRKENDTVTYIQKPITDFFASKNKPRPNMQQHVPPRDSIEYMSEECFSPSELLHQGKSSSYNGYCTYNDIPTVIHRNKVCAGCSKALDAAAVWMCTGRAATGCCTRCVPTLTAFAVGSHRHTLLLVMGTWKP